LGASLLVFCAASLLGGCGPILSTVGLVRAEKALQEAVAAGSEQRAPYPTELARNLLSKAREEQGYSAYDVSTDLAEQAQTLAVEALEICREDGEAAPFGAGPADEADEPDEEKAPAAAETVPEAEEVGSAEEETPPAAEEASDQGLGPEATEEVPGAPETEEASTAAEPEAESDEEAAEPAPAPAPAPAQAPAEDSDEDGGAP